MNRAILQYVCGSILVLMGAAMGFMDESVISSWDQGACSFSLIGVGGLLTLFGWLKGKIDDIKREQYLIKDRLDRIQGRLTEVLRDREKGEKRL